MVKNKRKLALTLLLFAFLGIVFFFGLIYVTSYIISNRSIDPIILSYEETELSKLINYVNTNINSDAIIRGQTVYSNDSIRIEIVCCEVDSLGEVNEIISVFNRYAIDSMETIFDESVSIEICMKEGLDGQTCCSAQCNGFGMNNKVENIEISSSIVPEETSSTLALYEIQSVTVLDSVDLTDNQSNLLNGLYPDAIIVQR